MSKELFRAMSVHNNQWIINSWYKWQDDNLFMEDEDGVLHLCDADTRSVSYPNMIDKNGKKIFASLNEDGVGGDKLSDDYNETYIAQYCDIKKGFTSFGYSSQGKRFSYSLPYNKMELIGIHKG